VVVDSSALVSVILREPDAEKFVTAVLDREDRAYLGAVTALEASMVVSSRLGSAGLRLFDALVAELGLDIVPFDAEQAGIARAAYLRFGKGRHPARLNLGDCCAYALAKILRQPLLFKGRDFARTDAAVVTVGRS